MKENRTWYIWSKYKCFLINGCQYMDFYKTLRKKYHILEMYYILTSSSNPEHGPWVGYHGCIANPAGNIWSKYECFLKSCCQGMDIWKTLTQKTHILKINLILTSNSTPASSPESNVMERKSTLQGTYGLSMNGF